ncbi:IclR family transcriptional regulator [Conexibacter stalactiti]|uniref:IclR family transcriptional regulator n=1 Tax=Conexibacter stalactiti TaxID=1940611 RepID=A0ABU4HZ42_9ACTN|nr:IclR family transcriptional regulator [Conexibacter stalactiti]MDW5598541.1 IclR family transcriptional regulator [Conexibacter stalactiti]MEC5039183.1 IclR family transcriptional regulator [Conexibacter stalactiti]
MKPPSQNSAAEAAPAAVEAAAAPKAAPTGTQAIDRAVAILRALERGGAMTATEVAASVGLHVSTAHRILRSLCAHGLLGQSPTDDRYQLGLATVLLGRAAAEQLGLSAIVSHLEALRDETGETVNLGVRVDDEVAVAASIPSRHPLRVENQPGVRNPIHACAMGKTLLAFGDGRISVPEPYTRFTTTTLTTQARIDRDLERIRARGFAINDEERSLGIRSVGAPVYDDRGRLIAAIAVQGPIARMSEERLPAIYAAADRTATALRGVADSIAAP